MALYFLGFYSSFIRSGLLHVSLVVPNFLRAVLRTFASSHSHSRIPLPCLNRIP